METRRPLLQEESNKWEGEGMFCRNQWQKWPCAVLVQLTAQLPCPLLRSFMMTWAPALYLLVESC